MATANQIFQLVNDAAKEALGSQAITVKDTTTLVSLGDQVLSSDTTRDLYLGKLCDRIGITAIAIRAYSAQTRNVKRDELDWGLFYQKISYKKHEAVENPSYTFATQANPFDVEPQTEVVQKLFAVMGTWSYEDVIPDTQLFTAFTSASAMGAFISGIYTNIDNSLAIDEEDLANLAVNTYMAGALKSTQAAQHRNLLAEYNTANGTTITAAAALKNPDFLKFASREIKTVVGNMKKMSTVYNGEGIPRHTPDDKMVVEVLGQFASATATYLESDTYHKELVALPRYEEVAYWQGSGTSFAFEDVSSINVQNEKINGGTAVKQSGIIAFVHDYDAVASFINKPRRSSIYNPRTERTNIFYKATKGYGVDLSENGVVFYIADAADAAESNSAPAKAKARAKTSKA